ILGLETCADTMVGDQMRRGISGGEKKRVTIGEMLVGPANVFFMDEISNGLDSSTTCRITKFLREISHEMDLTMVISLLQPDPETYKLFDDVILMSEGQIVYQGPCENVAEFFELMGFKCPERKGVADFLQEVTSRKDQEQYWFIKDQPYRYITVAEFSRAFKSFPIGHKLETNIPIPCDKSKIHPDSLIKEKYGISNIELLKACFDREWLLSKRNSMLYIFKTVQLTFMSLMGMAMFFRNTMHAGSLDDGMKFFGSLFFGLVIIMFNGMTELALIVMRLPVFYKQRDSLLYPSWAFALPIWLLRIPLSLMESGIWVILTYYTIGYARDATRFGKQFLTFFAIHQMSSSLFRLIAVVARTEVLSNTSGPFILMMIVTLGGFVVAKGSEQSLLQMNTSLSLFKVGNNIATKAKQSDKSNDVISDDSERWISWGFYTSPMMYAQNALVINEFLDKRWSTPNIRVIYFHLNGILSFDAFGGAKPVIREDNEIKDFTNDRRKEVCEGEHLPWKKNVMDYFDILNAYEGIDMAMRSASRRNNPIVERRMVLPFQPLTLVFNHINYYIDTPYEMKAKGMKDNRLQLLKDVSGAFRPGILTALIGVSGAGKTTLMDVLAGRKTGGYTEGDIFISGYPKNQSTFARVSGYCEQIDIHSPNVTVYESLLYSAWLRLPSDVNARTRKIFVDELMELVELQPLRNGIVGLPGVNGLTIEQRKRFTIAVELVANPSIIFMDEPTSGLDARSAAIVMRTVRNTVDTGRTVVCTIHQPSIDIFESFDELLLMKIGGQIIYAGPLGHQSHKLVEHFEAIPGVPKIKNGYNPATWVLEVTSSSAEIQLNVDYAQIYVNSTLYQYILALALTCYCFLNFDISFMVNEKLIRELSSPTNGSKDLHFPTKYTQPFIIQCKACLWKQHWSYWRNPQYNVFRFITTIAMAALFAAIFFKKGEKIQQVQDLVDLAGALYAVVLFLGSMNENTVPAIVAVERAVFYRERAAGMYSSLPYALAQVAIESIYIGIQTSIYAFILYPMFGFEWTGAKFWSFYYYLFMSFIYFTLFGMMTMALTPAPELSAVLIYFFSCLWNLFSGFLVPRPQIPIWCRWYYWANPLSWSVYGLLTGQVGEDTSMVEVLGAGNMTVKGFIKQGLGYDYDFLPWVAIAHVGWILVFFFAFFCAIKFLNFQHR
ncbi:hypothetical protein M8C21_011098, partial [Ambrosia artemisiifolia]